MKRLILLAAVLMASAFCASAQYKTYYVVEQVGNEYPSFGRFMIDWEKKLFFLESDSERENDGRIKNYKENGSKRTFDVWSSATGDFDEKIYSMTFTTDGEDRFTLIISNSPEHKMEFKLSTVEPVRKENSSSAAAGESDGSLKSKINAKTGSIKDAIGKGVTKGLDALKNKKKDKEN